MKKRKSSKEVAEDAVALERSGEWEAAGGLYTELFRGGVERADPAAMVDALRGGARVQWRRGRFEEAEELAELSSEIAERHGLMQAAARAINMRAIIRHHQRDWSGAKALYGAARDLAFDVGDDELIGLSCQNLGVLANMRGDLREARAFYLESIGAAIRSGNKANEAMTYNNLGMVCADLGDWIEAELYFDRGIEIAERIGDRSHIARLYVNRAEPLISMGNLTKASASLDQAVTIASRIDAQATLADEARFRGTIARLTGDLQAASDHLARALRIAKDAGLELARAEALEEIAHLHQEQGRPGEASSTITAARDAFLVLGAERDAARATELLTAWEAAERG